MKKKVKKIICQPIEDVLVRLKKSKKITDNFYIEDHLYDPNQCSLYHRKRHIQFVVDYDEEHGLSLDMYINDCFKEWASKKNPEAVARGILGWLRTGSIGKSQESLVVKAMKADGFPTDFS